MAASAPVVTDVTPPSGTDAGGDVVMIEGSAFLGATGVLFGTQAALSYTVADDTHIKAVSPPALANDEVVHVIVQTPLADSKISGADRFIYISSAGAWTQWHTLGLALIVIVAGLFEWYLPAGMPPEQIGYARTLALVITLICVTGFLIVAGEGITNRWPGLLIDTRNQMSLSRFQAILWTIVVVSGFVTMAVANLATAQPNPLAITVPPQIWQILGISLVSLVGSPLILSTKTAKAPDPTEQSTTTNNAAKQQGIPEGNVTNNGLIVVKSRPKYANWSDLFKGEETGNADYLDIAKIQMFFFTLALVFVYTVNLFSLLATATQPMSTFPMFDSSMVTLLGISHAGYLGNKVIPHSQTS